MRRHCLSQPFAHRREILRAIWFDANTNANTFSDCNWYRDRYTNGNCDCDSYGNGYAELNNNPQPDAYT